jgi:uncharacterized protein YtpQ (UPF0354 family)
MKKFFQTILAALGLCSGCSKTDLLSPAQFTQEFAEAMRKASPDITVEIISDLQLKVKSADGQDTTSFLSNAYDLYRQDPRSKAHIIKTYVSSGLETLATLKSTQGLDRTRIVPVVKDQAWLEETHKVVVEGVTKEMTERVYDELNADLVVVYAEDTPKNISYFGPKDLELAHIDRQDLRALACENLKRLLPKIERQGKNGLYMITAGGDYEASLLVLDSVWTNLPPDVHGDPVVAIPTRDLLIFTGSEDSQGIAKLKEFVQQATAQGSYRLTSKLFVRRGGKIEEFTGQ